MQNETVIETEGLTRRFGQTTAVDNLSLTVQRGEVFGLLGHNGAGKTTTVRLLNGVLTPGGGRARVLGLDPMTQGPALRQRTGVLTETPSLYENLSAWDNLSVFADLYGVPRGEVQARVDEILAVFDLSGRSREKVGGYSKGMKQRLALARAFLHRPELLFLDEPAAGLDPVAARQVNDHILELSRHEGRTVLLATHNLHDAARLCDRVAVLEQGRLIALGAPAELTQQAAHNLTIELQVHDEDAAPALELLAALPEVESSTSEGPRLTLSGVEQEAIPGLLARLVQAGVRIYRVNPHEPTLEDVYFALHRSSEERGRPS